jgi:hypothetical protein
VFLPFESACLSFHERRRIKDLSALIHERVFTNMKFQTYTSTPGLERFAKQDRFARWQAAHKELLRENVSYRKRFHSYLGTIVCLSCAMMPFYLPMFGVQLFGIVADISLILGLAATVVYVALRQMTFMNQSIGRHLQSKHDA